MRSEPSSSAMPATSRSAVTRLAWIAADREALLLLRAPLLRDIAGRRHKVLAMAPDLTDADRLALSKLGVDSERAVLPGASRNPLIGLASRRRLAAALQAWGANAVVADVGTAVDPVTRAAAQSGCPSLYPVVPAAGAGLITARLAAIATTVLASTADDARILAAGRPTAAPVVLPPAAIDLGATPQSPLPGLEDGLVVAAIDAPDVAVPLFADAVGRLERRARFRLLTDATRTANQAVVGLDRQPCTFVDPLALAAQLRVAHLVVIDGHTPRHRAALAIALALGRPVLAVDDPHHRDLVDSGVNGWLAPAVAEGFAAALGAALKRPDLLPSMARAARHKAERTVDAAAISRRLTTALGLSDLTTAAAA
jgi:hypothetical protein